MSRSRFACYAPCYAQATRDDQKAGATCPSSRVLAPIRPLTTTHDYPCSALYYLRKRVGKKARVRELRQS